MHRKTDGDHLGENPGILLLIAHNETGGSTCQAPSPLVNGEQNTASGPSIFAGESLVKKRHFYRVQSNTRQERNDRKVSGLGLPFFITALNFHRITGRVVAGLRMPFSEWNSDPPYCTSKRHWCCGFYRDMLLLVRTIYANSKTLMDCGCLQLKRGEACFRGFPHCHLFPGGDRESEIMIGAWAVVYAIERQAKEIAVR